MAIVSTSPLTESVISRALDTAWIIDTTTITTLSDLGGGTVNLGTGGEVKLIYKRLGRTVFMFVEWKVGTSNSWGAGTALYIPNSSLPIPAISPVSGYANPGGFGYMNVSGVVATEVAGPGFADVGGPIVLCFITQPGDGGIGNLMSNLQPIPVITGGAYQGFITYEAAAAA